MMEVERIKQILTEDERLCYLEEKAIELSRAAFKLRRTLLGVNPTPIGRADARDDLLEKYGDVLNVMETIITPTENAYVVDRRSHKRELWANRLEEYYGA